MVLFQSGHTPNSPQGHDRDVSAAHSGQSLFLMCDGSVHGVHESIDLEIYLALSTMAGQETIATLD